MFGAVAVLEVPQLVLRRFSRPEVELERPLSREDGGRVRTEQYVAERFRPAVLVGRQRVNNVSTLRREVEALEA